MDGQTSVAVSIGERLDSRLDVRSGRSFPVLKPDGRKGAVRMEHDLLYPSAPRYLFAPWTSKEG